ncbi:MAG: SMP-30/gluconolactonase/LRE family protein [Myxococcales bacterium]|nr:SMP-30/gluconolactonase/LRE family protein [Myxococcales bacterium]MCB9642259.1 SMP-30/gluconolactonase/LRE family protein [Myxococcales bacterium]
MSTKSPIRSYLKFALFFLLAIGLVMLISAYASIPQMQAWQPPKAPGPQGALAPNQRLQAASLLGTEALLEPEDVVFDAKGRLYTGSFDGMIWRLEPAGSKKPEVFAKTGGRPLGMVFGPDQTLYVADAVKGLLAISPQGKIRVLASGYQGKNFRFTNEIDLDPKTQELFFTDASRWVGIFDEHRLDIASGIGTGRLFRYNLKTNKLEKLLDGLHFANGVALSPDASFLWIAETARYRILRYWRRGPKAGKIDVFASNLPGFPDNISRSRDGGLWVALVSTRVTLLDVWMHPHARLKRFIFALPSWVRPSAQRHGYVVRLDAKGHVAETLQDPTGKKFSNVTSAVEHNGSLYLGQIYRHVRGLGVLKLAPKK